MLIEQIHVKNYKVFKDTKIPEDKDDKIRLSSLCVFLGANGSGKTTFFDVIGFLHDSLIDNVSQAIEDRGGPKEVWTRGVDPEKENIFIEIKFRNAKAFENKKINPRITYSIKIGFSEGKAIVQSEVLKYRRGKHGRPWHFLDFSEGEGSAVKNEEDYGREGVKEQRGETLFLREPDRLAIKGLGQFGKFKVIADFRELLERWYVSDFSVDAARKDSDTGIATHLDKTGAKLAQVTKHLQSNKPEVLKRILDKLPKRIPGISKVEAVDMEDGRVVLKFKEDNFDAPFMGKYVSDGTMKMFAYMVLLYDPDPFPLLCIEEPENFLYPDLLEELVEEIRDYAAKGGQVFVSTHSPEFVNALEIDELFFIKKESGTSKIKAAKGNKEVVELVENGNQLGWLWRNKYIEDINLP